MDAACLKARLDALRFDVTLVHNQTIAGMVKVITQGKYTALASHKALERFTYLIMLCPSIRISCQTGVIK